MDPFISTGILKPLTWLEGKWQGKGSGGFPTLAPFTYFDQMHFRFFKEAFEQEPLIHLEETAWVHEGTDKKFKHWETGFFKPAPDGSLSMYTLHNTGRIEVMSGRFERIDEAGKHFSVTFGSEVIRNEKGLEACISSQRMIELEGDKLTCSMTMTTSKVPHKALHLKTLLNKVSD